MSLINKITLRPSFFLVGVMMLGLCSLTSCVTPAEERQIKGDIEALQTRMVQVEGLMSEQDRSISNKSNQQAASTNTRIERIQRDIQQIRGDLDTLRVGVITGQLPGINSENEGSVAKTLETLEERIKEMEEVQQKILQAIDQAEKSAAKNKKSSEKGPKISSLEGLQKAYDDKRYRHVAENGVAVLKKQSSKKDREVALYLYAESLFKLGRIRDAALKFSEYIDLNPSNHLAHARMRMGDCFRMLGDAATAKIYYEELISKHAKSEEAKRAEERLAKLTD